MHKTNRNTFATITFLYNLFTVVCIVVKYHLNCNICSMAVVRVDPSYNYVKEDKELHVYNYNLLICIHHEIK